MAAVVLVSTQAFSSSLTAVAEPLQNAGTVANYIKGLQGPRLRAP